MRSLGQMVLSAALFGWAMSWMPVQAAAQPSSPLTGACADDVKKFCPDVKPGGGRIVQCLKQHDAELSAGCKKSPLLSGSGAAGPLGAAKEHRQGPNVACKADVEKFCRGVEPGGGRIVKCLEEHTTELSPVCKAYRSKENKADTK